MRRGRPGGRASQRMEQQTQAKTQFRRITSLQIIITDLQSGKHIRRHNRLGHGGRGHRCNCGRLDVIFRAFSRKRL